ncbi:urea ABC transporter permease subunit UrtB [Oleiphilus sp. HI0130]|nr:urea ABC transporter permease subunit UrtB [Oleiphilus sp. HI0079]KZZ63531.1 urea ABC transporter permease subunit UrtB [Oleiphilus sp. HI0130]
MASLRNCLGRSVIALILTIMSLSTHANDTGLYEQGIDLLITGKLKKVEQGVSKLIASKNESADMALEALLNGDLYRHKKQKQLVVLESKSSEGMQVVYLNEPSKSELITKKRAIKRVPVNNNLRREIRAYLAAKNLQHSNVEKRQAAVESLLSGADETALEIVHEQRQVEKNADILFLLDSVIALDSLESENTSIKLKAIETLSESLQPQVRNRLQKVVEKGEAPFSAAAEKALAKIQDKAEFYGWMETIFFGLSLGSVLVLAAIGLAITFGVMGCINMAHGELIMIGAYTTYVIQLLMPDSIGASIIVAIPAAFVVSGLVGIAIERGVIQFLKGRPLETLLATFGISLVLQQAVRSIFSPLNRSVETPEWMSGSIDINPIFSLTLNRLYIIIFCLAVFALLFFILKKTVLGLQVRAVSQNREMARAMGVRSEWVDALTFGLGSGIAGVAGVALSQLTNVGPNLGQSYIIDSFMVVVFGGVGNLWGTLVAGMSLGVANKLLEPVSGAVLAKILVLVFIILFIQKKPRGLFPQKGRAAEA